MICKASRFMFSVLLFASTVAEARYLGPILVKETKSAPTVAELTKAERCEVFSDRVVVTTLFGEPVRLTSVQTIPTTLQGDVQNLLLAAQKGVQLRLPATFDVPSIRHFGQLIGADDKIQYVGLTYENTKTGEFVFNQAAEARLLVNVIESLCAATLKSGTNPASN